jgi:hypothetical protein
LWGHSTGLDPHPHREGRGGLVRGGLVRGGLVRGTRRREKPGRSPALANVSPNSKGKEKAPARSRARNQIYIDVGYPRRQTGPSNAPVTTIDFFDVDSDSAIEAAPKKAKPRGIIMTALLQFLQRNQITKDHPLPLVHTTESYFLKKIITSGKIEARRCNVFKNENLSYFFVGRAAYKRDLYQEAEYWELPTCLVFSFFVDGVKRMYPFDSGAFRTKRYPNFVNMMNMNDFEVGKDPEAPHKIIGTFFGSARNYYRLAARPKEQFESKFEVEVLDEEMKALYKLILAKDKKYDDRRFAIEMQFDHDVELRDKSPMLAIFPETYLGDDAYMKKIKALGTEILTYPVYPLRKEYFYYSIYEKLDQFYASRGFYNV